MTYEIDKSIMRCRAFAEAAGYTKSALALKAGLSTGTLKDFWQDHWSPTATTLRAIEALIPLGSTILPDVALAPMNKGLLTGQRILLIIGGGIAAYKSLDLARRLMERGASVTGVLTKGGAEFITPLSVASLTGHECYTDLFSLKDEADMGHIRLSRECDVILVAPATADMMAKMAAGLAGDLATTVLLATDKPVIIAPAMNAQMWAHPATRRNMTTLKADGIDFIDAAEGMLACGEVGKGRMADVMDMVAHIEAFFIKPMASNTSLPLPLRNKHIVITAGPTIEPIDPVRYIANRSSGKQGFDIAAACAALGAQVTLVAGPVNQPDPIGVKRVNVESAREMQAAVNQALPADVFVGVAAVADWRAVHDVAQKMKKEHTGLPALELVENPDILATISQRKQHRPSLVVGFAAETQNVADFATAKRKRKGCDWIMANDVSASTGIMGGDENQVILINDKVIDYWPKMCKKDVAEKLAQCIADHLENLNAARRFSAK